MFYTTLYWKMLLIFEENNKNWILCCTFVCSVCTYKSKLVGVKHRQLSASFISSLISHQSFNCRFKIVNKIRINEPPDCSFGLNQDSEGASISDEAAHCCCGPGLIAPPPPRMAAINTSMTQPLERLSADWLTNRPRWTNVEKHLSGSQFIIHPWMIWTCWRSTDLLKRRHIF